MLDITTITKYRTSDGTEFDDMDSATSHEANLLIGKLKKEDLILKNFAGKTIELNRLWFEVDNVFYVDIRTAEALTAFNNASLSVGTAPIETGIGVYRYSTEDDRWVTPQEEINQLQTQWAIYNEKLKFTIT